MAKLFKKNEYEYEQESQKRSTKCNMSGCPLTGTMSDNTRGGGPWWCRYHYRKRDPSMFYPEEADNLRKIAYEYNAGKREYIPGEYMTLSQYQTYLLSRIADKK